MKLLEILNKYGESRIVGGYVREFLLHKYNIETRGRKPLEDCDIDIATILKPDEVIELCKKERIKFIPTGLEHGTVTAVYENVPYEITTLRRDVTCDGRHAEVEYTDNWQEDAKRRDFTINAISMGIDGTIYDYFSGVEDLQNKRVCFVGVAGNRIKEDYLRIMRYFRFSAYYADNIDEDLLDIIKSECEGLKQISVERIWDEMRKILKFPYILLDMQNAGVLGYVFPEIEFKELNFSNHYLENLAALLKANNITEINMLAKRLKISNKDKKFLELMLSDVNAEHKVVVYKIGMDMAQRYFNIEHILGKSALVDVSNIGNIPPMPINGNDLMGLGLTGKNIGKELARLDEIYIKSDFMATKESLLDSVSFDN